MPDIEKHLVRNPKQVLTYLTMLLKERCLISASFGEENKEAFLTTLIDIDEKNKTLTVDCGPKEYLNKKLLNSSTIKYRSKYKGIEVIFEGQKVKKSATLGQPAFLFSIPASIFWIQRRLFYRVKSPLAKKSYCILSYKPEGSEEKKVAHLTLHDLSASGISILNESSELSKLLTPDTIFSKCQLILDNENDLNFDLKIRHKRMQNPSQLGKTEIIGCYIMNSSPKIESSILRYMHHIESEIKLKSK